MSIQNLIHQRRLTSLIVLSLLIAPAATVGATLSCLRGDRIAPFRIDIDTTNAPGGYANPNNQKIQLMACPFSGGGCSAIPTSAWAIANPVMTWVLYGSSDNTKTSSLYSDVGDGFMFESGDGNWVFSRFTSTLILNTEIEAERIALRIQKIATGSYSDTELSGYTVIPGKMASWELPAVKYLGDIQPGESHIDSMSGPTGAKGLLRTLNATEGGDFIKINGCGIACSSEVGDGELVTIEASPPADIPEGEYSLTIEATLSCD